MKGLSMTTALEELAHRMFIRNVADYAEPALAELAWIDPDIRRFWVQQAQDVMADFTNVADVNDREGLDTQSSDKTDDTVTWLRAGSGSRHT
jgi:hypothetical protein